MENFSNLRQSRKIFINLFFLFRSKLIDDLMISLSMKAGDLQRGYLKGLVQVMINLTLSLKLMVSPNHAKLLYKTGMK